MFAALKTLGVQDNYQVVRCEEAEETVTVSRTMINKSEELDPVLSALHCW